MRCLHRNESSNISWLCTLSRLPSVGMERQVLPRASQKALATSSSGSHLHLLPQVYIQRHFHTMPPFHNPTFLSISTSTSLVKSTSPVPDRQLSFSLATVSRALAYTDFNLAFLQDALPKLGCTFVSRPVQSPFTRVQNELSGHTRSR